MRKNLFKILLCLTAAFAITACSSDDDPVQVSFPGNSVTVSNGAYIVCSGNESSQISGSLTYINYNSTSAIQGVFKTANNRNLGLTANDGVTYGSKMYIVVSDENTIEVMDKNSLKSLSQISTTALLGTKNGAMPRHLFTGNGKVYVTTYGGYVAAIDTASYKLTQSWQVGSYPEGITGYGNDLYVTNSDYGNGHGTISVINVVDNTVKTSTVKGIENPQNVFVNNNGVYVMDWGHYLSISPWTQQNAGLKKISENGDTCSLVADATLASYYNGTFYLINAAYGASAVSYSAYNASTGKSSTLSSVSVDSPAAIAVDPVSGNLFIASYNLGLDSYTTDGYVSEFSNSGTLIKKFDCGVGPVAVFFNTNK